MSSFDELSTAGHSRSGEAPDTHPLGAPDVLSRPAIPERIGPYVIRSVLGEGGFGIVLLAEQREPVARRVALKLIKPGMDSASVIARFEAERQALAVMDHPCVAKVFDGGTTDAGLPYFVMEHVPGEPITQFCEQEGLGLDERLALFEQVCDAVQHAHQKGIIHRDLKPSNILVARRDGRPAPKVIDFGIAKALHQRLTEKTIFTHQGVFIGTPEYMAPEQAGTTGVDVDTRADVYSLGVILYELLTGSRPFDSHSLRSRGFAEIQRIIREVDPPRPSTRLSELASKSSAARPSRTARDESDTRSAIRRLRRDLDWVIMKCLEKERGRRYATASALAEEIARVRRHEPVEAGPPSVRYRAGKFVRRHRAAVGGAAVVALALLAAATVSTAFALSEARQRKLTADALDREEAAHDRTEEALAREAEARQQAERNERIARAITAFLNADLLGAADPDADGPGARVIDVLRRASATVDARFGDDPAVEAEVRAALGSAYAAIGAPDEAMAHLERAALLFERLGARASPVALRAEITRGEALWRRQRAEESMAVLTAALHEHLQRRGPDAAPDLIELEARSQIANAHKYAGRPDDAEPLYREVLAGQERLLGPTHRSTLLTRYNLALLPELRSRAAEGETRRAGVEASLAELQAVWNTARPALGDDNPLTLTVGTEVAAMLNRLDRLDEALAVYRALERPLRARLGDTHWRTRQFMANQGRLLQKMERHAEAIAPLELALAGYLAEPGAPTADARVVTLWTARSQSLAGERERAERTLLRTLEALADDADAARDFAARAATLYDDLGDEDAAAAWRERPEPLGR